MKKLIFLFVFVFAAIAGSADAGLLNSNVTGKIDKQNQELVKESGFDPNATVGGIVAQVIKVFLSLLGLIFVVLIIYAGFMWMTADGDETKVTKAKQLISRAVIGLVIITSAYAITYFVFNNLLTASGPVDGGGGGPL